MPIPFKLKSNTQVKRTPMKNPYLQLLFPFVLLIFFSSLSSYAQNSSTDTKNTSVKTIWDIPHKTLRQKWMWIHRTVTFKVTQARPITYDTTYFISYSKRLVVTLPVSTRLLQFSLIDSKSGNKLVFAPNLEYDLGVSISSRWASFIINTGVALFHDDIDKKGKTTYRDYQLNLYGRKITTDMFVQLYNGYYIKNSNSYNNYTNDKPYAIRPDVRAINIGVSNYYIFNHKKFSYKNSFAFVEQQKKSAGSVLLGIYYTYFYATGNPSLVTQPFRSSFDTLSFIHSVYTNSFGLNFGYIYTLVFLKKFYATASLVQGFGGKMVVYSRDDNSMIKQWVGGAGKLNVRLALGYNKGRYFIGTLGMVDYYFFRGKMDSTFDHSFGKFMVYIGYRFSVLKAEQKLLHRLNLIGY
jgi:hypothetical protein